ncbi:hypothetical protein Q0F98_24470 [Paenibacillus amylolyticus]|nr:hypothetical protein Q0F98_24470 [Paenibacillus amylolyticus]
MHSTARRETSAYVAGLIAGQRLNQSTTYAATPFDDVTRRWTCRTGTGGTEWCIYFLP